MSKRYACGSGRCIEISFRPLDLGTEIGVHDSLRLQQIDPACEELLELFLETEVGVGVFAGGHGLELDQEIEVAPHGVEVLPGRRAEQLEPPHSVPDTEAVQLVGLE